MGFFLLISDESLATWERERSIGRARLVAFGQAVDRALASWIDLVWVRLRARPCARGYAGAFSQRMDLVIWNMLEAELVCACDHVVRTPARVKVLFSSSISVVRVFFPNRFLGLCRHGGATPFFCVPFPMVPVLV